MNETPSIKEILESLKKANSDLDFWLSVRGVALSSEEYFEVIGAIQDLDNLVQSFEIYDGKSE
jgi:hypothetical protein